VPYKTRFGVLVAGIAVFPTHRRPMQCNYETDPGEKRTVWELGVVPRCGGPALTRVGQVNSRALPTATTTIRSRF